MPGDKSISHRAAILATMAEGETKITNFSPALDCQSTLACLEALGVEVTRSGNVVTVKGVGKGGFQPPGAPLDCGNSGTTTRLLAGVLVAQAFESVLTGDESLNSRPMSRILEPLKKMGASIEASEGRLPLHIFGGQELTGIEHQPVVASAQVKSCLLLAGLRANGRTTVVEPIATRDHTERMLQWLGADIELSDTEAGRMIAIIDGTTIAARDVDVPGDISSAAFFLVAAACLPGSDLTIRDVGLNPTRTAILDVLSDAGAQVELIDVTESCSEPRGTVRIRGGIDVDSSLVLAGDMIAKLIDELPVLAVLGTRIERFEIRDAAELRYKETDRILAVAENLRRRSAMVEEFPDGLIVTRSKLTGGVVDPFGDHRIAMAFAVAGLLADGETEITNAECIDISFPGFFDTLSSVVR
jgi:3-phosphoshikimate 1-carboxyvinyltransferase